MKIPKPKLDDNIFVSEKREEIVFSFKYLQDKSITDKTQSEFYYKYLFRLKKLCELGWKEINKSHKHSFGTEKIPREQINSKSDIPILTDDVTKLTVFRATGDNHVFMGVRDDNCFYVIFIEANFGDIYSHDN